MRLQQVLVGAGPGDAVTQIARTIRDVLGPVVGAEIYAVYRDHGVSDIHHVNDMPAGTADDVVLYHLSIGEESLTDMLMHRPERLLLHYHNITPPEFFVDTDPVFAAKLRTGRAEMRMLTSRADAVIADSAFNASEIRPHTLHPVRVMAPPLRFDRFTHIEPHPPTVHHMTTVVQSPVVLVLGQVLPHKRPEVATGAAFVLRAHLGVDAQIVIAGAPRDPIYAAQLAAFADRLGVDNVWMAGRLPESELAAVFRRADVLMVPSAHEGFCVPIAEAFHLGVPVVARAAGAIPETLGDGGMLLPESAGPELFAEAIARVVSDSGLHADMSARSSASSERFGPHTMAALVELVTEMAR
ncbi:MAG: glycosyltransferase family 4 protein [Acidimicrobiales bacterium]